MWPHKLKKFKPLDKGKVLKELVIHLFKVDTATYYCTLNRMKRNQTWLRQIFSLIDCILAEDLCGDLRKQILSKK